MLCLKLSFLLCDERKTQTVVQVIVPLAYHYWDCEIHLVWNWTSSHLPFDSSCNENVCHMKIYRCNIKFLHSFHWFHQKDETSVTCQGVQIYQSLEAFYGMQNIRNTLFHRSIESCTFVLVNQEKQVMQEGYTEYQTCLWLPMWYCLHPFYLFIFKLVQSVILKIEKSNFSLFLILI